MAYEVLMTQKAADDIEDIYAYIAFDLEQPIYALRLVNKIRQ